MGWAMTRVFKRKSSKLPTQFGNGGKSFGQHGLLGLLSLMMLITGACTEIRWETGRLPDVNVLKQNLTLGDSTTEDVRAALGQPSGEGGLMMPVIDSKPRKIWSYYYSRGYMREQNGRIVGDLRRIGLFIYFDDGRYDGYQWFSTLPEHAQEKLVRHQGS